jgi:S-formylglutathione hydrolase
MYDYVVKELPALLSENFEQLDTSRASIFGHSMGGHGALTIYLKNLDKYKVLSLIGKTSIWDGFLCIP